MRLGDLPEQGEWVKLADEPPYELAFGVVGRFWAGETIWKTIDAARVRHVRASPGSRRSPAACRCAPTGPRGRWSPTRRARRRSTPTRARTSSATGASCGRAWRSSCARSSKPLRRRCADAHPRRTARAKAPIREAARAFGVVFGPSVVLDATAGAAVATALHALRRHRRPSRVVALASGARRRLPRRRPAADAPLGRELRGAPQAAPRRRVRPRARDPVHAGDDDRGPAGRGLAMARATGPGPRRLLQLRVPREPRRLPDAQRRRDPSRVAAAEPGETVYLHPLKGLPVTRFEPGRVFALEDWGAWVLEPHGAELHTTDRARPDAARTRRSSTRC